MPSLQVDQDAEALARQLLAAADALVDLESTNRRAGEAIAGAPAPHRTGALAQSVNADASANGVVVGSSLRYATFVHWGAPRHHVRAQPWLLEKLESNQAELIDLYREHAANAVADNVKG